MYVKFSDKIFNKIEDHWQDYWQDNWVFWVLLQPIAIASIDLRSCLIHCRAINMITFGNFYLSLTSIYSVNSLSKLKIKDSFEICLSWGFQNCPWYWILTKNWLKNAGQRQMKISESAHVYRPTVYVLVINQCVEISLNMTFIGYASHH